MTLNGVHCKLARPRLSAVMTAWVRSPAFSLLRMWLTWNFTVLSAMKTLFFKLL